MPLSPELTEFIKACIGGNTDRIETCLASGKVDINHLYSSGEHNEFGSGVDCTQLDLSCLHIAVFLNNEDVFYCLLNHGADVNVLNSTYNTPLHTAAHSKRCSMLTDLLERGAHVNASNSTHETALHLSCTYCGTNTPWSDLDSVFLVRQLIKFGADISAKNDRSDTALHTAVYYCNTEAALFLLSNYSPTDTADAGDTFYDIVAPVVENGDVKVTKELIRHGVDINLVRKYDGEVGSLLHHAARFNQDKIVDILIDAGASLDLGADLRTPHTAGWTALHIAVWGGHIRAVAALLRHGANPLLRRARRRHEQLGSATELTASYLARTPYPTGIGRDGDVRRRFRANQNHAVEMVHVFGVDPSLGLPVTI